ncbi:dephospho-CoA kinase [Ornithinicoccus hortensis]|uniref:Dephospho-CoA kinase n=1 Tax=Ornithinicoccus hortensis TaxID=82346 RepID=A0A542YSK5_9MICO|nr:dephospho-CoA kinase [Ornithinicoccus hortensis]TQL51079.1 dephospho-CoA kinase [Ornithinicoccus hortensis]
MLWIGLTGGIGSGKSTVSGRLAELGAVVLDADRIAREVVEPDTPGLTRVVERFGAGVLDDSGALDRPALGRIVFADPAARRDLEAITHPLVRERTAALRNQLPDDSIVVHDVPLLVELGYAPAYHLVVLVGASEETRVERLVRTRGMDPEEARSRMGTQADDAARRAVADVWLDNEGSPADLQAQVDQLYAERLAPLGANLGRRRAARVEDLVPPTPGEDLATRADRVAGRLAHLVGEQPAASRHTFDGTFVRSEIQVPDPCDPALRRRLRRGGFPAVGEHEHAAADPGRLAMVVLHGPDARSVGGSA